MTTDNYCRRATITRWVDGDTVKLTVDLGYRTSRQVSIRLIDVWAPERYRGDEEERAAGRAALEFCESTWPAGTEIVVKSELDRKSFDRYLGHLFDAQGGSIGEAIVAAGHATAERS